MSLLNHLIPSLARESQAATCNANCATDAGYTVKPVHEIAETPEAFRVKVYLPGVAKDGLDLTAEEGQIRIAGRRAWKQPEGWKALYREGTAESFELLLNHDNAIDVEKISAELRDGVLHVSLPKHEALKPRKIAVT